MRNEQRDEDRLDCWLQTMPDHVLVAAAKNPKDTLTEIRKSIASRGIDKSGAWVGFDNAKKVWKVSV